MKVVDTARCRRRINIVYTADLIQEYRSTRPLVNKESLYMPSSYRDDYKRQRMGEVQDWPITVPFLDRRSRRGRRRSRGRRAGWGCFMRSPISISGVLRARIDGIAAVSSKWDMGQD